MAEDSPVSRGEQLREDFHGQTARIPFSELQRYFAGGRLVLVSTDLDLVEVAVELAMDNRERFEAWTRTEDVTGVSDEQARDWLQRDHELWAVVADPWVLIQDRAGD